MKAKVVGQLGMERGHEHVLLPRHHRVAVDLREHLHPVAGLLDPWRADEDRPQRLVPEALHVHVLLEAADLAPEGVAARLDVHQAQVRAVEHDQPGAGAEHRPPAAHEVPYGLLEAVGLDPHAHRRALAAGEDQPVEPIEVTGAPDLHGDRAEAPQRIAVGLEAALDCEHADPRPAAAGSPAGAWPRRYQPRCWSRLPSSRSLTSRPGIASPSDSEASRDRARILVVRGGVDDRPGPRGWVRGLEDPRADEHALGPELHHQRGVRRRGEAAGGEVDHRQAALGGDLANQLERRAQLLGGGRQLGPVHRREPPDPGLDRAHVPHGLDDVAGAGLALRADHGRALGDPPQRLAQVGGAAHERHA